MTARVFAPAEGLRCAVADNPGPMTLDGTRSYLVGRREAVLLDPGPAGAGQADRLARLLEDGPAVTAVCLSHAHPDHAGGAARVARELGVPLAASAGTLARLGADGRALEDGDEMPLDGGRASLAALATPGHSADHLAYLWRPEGAVFTGDLVLGSGTAMVGHPDGHMGSYLASLERLLELDPTRLYPGHGEPVDDAEAKLRGYAAHRRDREEQVLEAVREGAGSVAEVRRRVYGELPEGLAWAAEASIRAHLAHLEERGEPLPAVAGRDDDAAGEH